MFIKNKKLDYKILLIFFNEKSIENGQIIINSRDSDIDNVWIVWVAQDP